MKYIKLLPLISILLIIILLVYSSYALADMTHVLISEIQTSGDTPNHPATDEFVELYNPTESSVDLSGWVLKRKDSGGTPRTLQTLSGTVPAHGYFLVANPYYNGAVIPDNLYASASAGIADNNVVLLFQSDGTTIVDKVGFGSAVESETAPYSVNPPANGSLERISNIDTDNNSADFQTRTTSDPQNSSFIEETPSPSPSASPTESPTEVPTPTETSSPTASPTNTPVGEPTPTPSETPTPPPTNTPPGWLKSPVFTCTNNHIPTFTYSLLKNLMPWKFNCS